MTAQARYVPGDRVAIATPDAWLLVDLPPEHELVQRCWWLLSQSADVDDVLDVLVSGGVRSMPSFALVGRVAGERRAVVRGDVRVVIEGGTTVQASSARGWADEGLPEYATVTLISGRGPNPDDQANPDDLADSEDQADSDDLVMTPGLTMAASVTVETIDVDAATTAGYRPPPGVSPVEETTDFTPFAALTDTERINTAASPGLIDDLPWMTTPGVEGPGSQDSGPGPTPPIAPPIVGPSVIAGRCPAGHLSPPHVLECRVCHTAMPAQTGFETGRPVLGVLHLSTGDDVTLDRGVLFGRAPEIPGDLVERPNIVKLVSPENDISRTHAVVSLEGWFVHVTDLGSTNGTTVTLPGEQPIRLRPHDQHLLEPGAVVSLADEVSFGFEVIA